MIYSFVKGCSFVGSSSINLIGEILQFVATTVVIFDLLSYVFLSYFPVVSSVLGLLQISGQNVTNWIILAYTTFIIVFLFRRYYKSQIED